METTEKYTLYQRHSRLKEGAGPDPECDFEAVNKTNFDGGIINSHRDTDWRLIMKKLTKRSAIAAMGLALAATTLSISTPTYAVVETSTSAVNTNEHGLALHGYDPVAYFTENGPKKGKKKYAVRHTGGTYYFSSEKNKNAFMENPDRYLPEYGGFCAMGVALGKKLDGDPNVWKIIGNKLYLNVNKDVAVAWQRDIPGNLTNADENWPDLKHRTPASIN